MQEVSLVNQCLNLPGKTRDILGHQPLPRHPWHTQHKLNAMLCCVKPKTLKSDPKLDKPHTWSSRADKKGSSTLRC